MDQEGFLKKADQLFAPVYPVIVEEMLKGSKRQEGRALDVGTGGGHLGLALLLASDFKVDLMDVSADMVEETRARLKREGLENRAQVFRADVHQIPRPPAHYDLVISRGSLFFWQDWDQALGEILRVLKEGGSAVVGGGFGSQELKDRIRAQMKKENPSWQRFEEKRVKDPEKKMIETLARLGVKDYEITNQDAGFWTLFHKEGKNTDD